MHILFKMLNYSLLVVIAAPTIEGDGFDLHQNLCFFPSYSIKKLRKIKLMISNISLFFLFVYSSPFILCLFGFEFYSLFEFKVDLRE